MLFQIPPTLLHTANSLITDSHIFSKKYLIVLWNQNFHYHVHISQPLAPTLSERNRASLMPGISLGNMFLFYFQNCYTTAQSPGYSTIPCRLPTVVYLTYNYSPCEMACNAVVRNTVLLHNVRLTSIFYKATH